jgi:hypothetical protein
MERIVNCSVRLSVIKVVLLTIDRPYSTWDRLKQTKGNVLKGRTTHQAVNQLSMAAACVHQASAIIGKNNADRVHTLRSTNLQTPCL